MNYIEDYIDYAEETAHGFLGHSARNTPAQSMAAHAVGYVTAPLRYGMEKVINYLAPTRPQNTRLPAAERVVTTPQKMSGRRPRGGRTQTRRPNRPRNIAPRRRYAGPPRSTRTVRGRPRQRPGYVGALGRHPQAGGPRRRTGVPMQGPVGTGRRTYISRAPTMNRALGGNSANYMNWGPAPPGCAKLSGRLRIATMWGDAGADQPFFRLKHNGSTTDVQQLILQPGNTLYFPSQFTTICRMYSKYRMSTRLEYKPASSNALSISLRLAHVYDATQSYGYSGTSTPLLTADDLPSYAFDAQAHQQETAVWKPCGLPWMRPDRKEDNKCMVFPTMDSFPDATIEIKTVDGKNTTTYDYTPSQSDIRGATAGAYWINAGVNGAGFSNSELGVFFLHFEIVLCDMVTSTASDYVPPTSVDVTTSTLAATSTTSEGTVVTRRRVLRRIDSTHPSCKLIPRPVKGRESDSVMTAEVMGLSRCPECKQFEVNGDCLCTLTNKMADFVLDIKESHERKREKKKGSTKSTKSSKSDDTRE